MNKKLTVVFATRATQNSTNCCKCHGLVYLTIESWLFIKLLTVAKDISNSLRKSIFFSQVFSISIFFTAFFFFFKAFFFIKYSLAFKLLLQFNCCIMYDSIYILIYIQELRAYFLSLKSLPSVAKVFYYILAL